MKPDWKDAPDWANYLAMDGNREWFWYENEPSKENGFTSTKAKMKSEQCYERVPQNTNAF